MTLKEEIEILNNEIKQCQICHQELAREECENCNVISCELSKKGETNE